MVKPDNIAFVNRIIRMDPLIRRQHQRNLIPAIFAPLDIVKKVIQIVACPSKDISR